MIKITCDCKTLRPIGELKPFQGDIKSMSKKEREKLIRLIETYGLRFPFFSWNDNIINGHQRYDVLTNDFKYTGVIPVVEIEAENEKEARELVLVSGSSNGRYNIDELEAFTKDLDDIDIFSLVDGPHINLEFKVSLDDKPVVSLIDDIEIVDSDEYEAAEVEPIGVEPFQEMVFPDGTKLVAGEDLYFFKEVIRMWNSRNKAQKVEI